MTAFVFWYAVYTVQLGVCQPECLHLSKGRNWYSNISTNGVYCFCIVYHCDFIKAVCCSYTKSCPLKPRYTSATIGIKLIIKYVFSIVVCLNKNMTLYKRVCCVIIIVVVLVIIININNIIILSSDRGDG